MKTATRPHEGATRSVIAGLVGIAAVFAAIFLSPLWFVVVVAVAAWNIVRIVRRSIAEPTLPIASSAVLIGINISLVLFVTGWLVSTALFGP